jgi:hypothetical protein
LENIGLYRVKKRNHEAPLIGSKWNLNGEKKTDENYAFNKQSNQNEHSKHKIYDNINNSNWLKWKI